MSKISVRDFCIGSGAAHAIGGLVGIAILPFGKYTVFFAVLSLIGAYIAQEAWKWQRFQGDVVKVVNTQLTQNGSVRTTLLRNLEKPKA